MMNAMMAGCCGDDGKPDFDLMKQFMEHCGKSEFSDADLQMMKQFCGQEGMPDMAKMKQMMESCGCHMPAWAQNE
jgi:hypothetical protein